MMKRAEKTKRAAARFAKPEEMIGLAKSSQHAFAIGERVRLSPLGLERSPKMKGYFGRVTRKGYGSSFYVLFDGTKTARSLHSTYLVSDEIVAG